MGLAYESLGHDLDILILSTTPIKVRDKLSKEKRKMAATGIHSIHPDTGSHLAFRLFNII